jgi:hypothetical protein
MKIWLLNKKGNNLAKVNLTQTAKVQLFPKLHNYIIVIVVKWRDYVFVELGL